MSTSSLVLIAVAPRYSPTRSARCASMTSGICQQAERVEDLGQHPGHRGLPGARRAEEHEVAHRLFRGHTRHRPPPGGLDGRGDRAHLLLDRRQPDHRVQFRHGVLDGDLRPGAGRGGMVVARRVFRVRQRRALSSDAVSGRMAAVTPRLVRGGRGVGRAYRGGSGGLGAGPGLPARALRAVHPPFLDALGQPPAKHGRGEQPRGDGADEQLVRQRLQRDGADRHRPGQRPGDRAARHEPAGQRPGVRGQRDDERQQQQRVEPGPVAGAQRGEDGHAPERDAHRGARGAPPLDHRDDRVDQGGQEDQAEGDREEHDGGGHHGDLEPGRQLPVGTDEASSAAWLVRRGGLGPVVWQHLASSHLVHASQPRHPAQRRGPGSKRPHPVAGQSYVLV